MSKLKKSLIHNCTFIIVLIMLVLPVVSLAETPVTPCDPNKGKICDPLEKNGTVDIPKFIHDVLEGAVKIMIPIIALAIIYCGFLFVFARGKPEELKKAKDALLYTIIGATLILGAWMIANLIDLTIKGLG